MRRQDREIRKFAEIIEIIQHCEIIHLGLTDQDGPYIVPLHFGFEICGESVCFYFHSAGEGRKVDILRTQPKVCFELDAPTKVQPGETVCGWTADFESVMGTGFAVILEDVKDKTHGLSCIMRNYGYKGIPKFQPDMLEKTLVIKLTADSITGKRRG